jgi:hypothetical protein
MVEWYVKETHPMPRNVQELEAEVLNLDLSARAALAEKLLRSLDDLTEAENEQLWLAEALRRREELQSGRAAPDGDTVLERAAAELS